MKFLNLWTNSTTEEEYDSVRTFLKPEKWDPTISPFFWHNLLGNLFKEKISSLSFIKLGGMVG